MGAMNSAKFQQSNIVANFQPINKMAFTKNTFSPRMKLIMPSYTNLAYGYNTVLITTKIIIPTEIRSTSLLKNKKKNSGKIRPNIN